MATLTAPTNVGGTSGTGWSAKYGIYTFNTTSDTPLYVHFKTNVPTNSEKIGTIEAIGYNFGSAQPIRCAWGFYVYSSGVASRGLETFTGSGLTANGIYKSSDNYLCIRGSSSTMYYIGFILNAYIHSTYNFDISITAANQNSNSGNYY